MHSRYIPLLGLAVALTVASPLSANPDKKVTQASSEVKHTVKRGETLWSIAQKHRTSVGEIMEYNRLDNDQVKLGSTLRIPQRATEDPRKPSQPRQLIHVVRPGEDLWAIAEKYDISSKELAKANPNINPNRLHEDMELVIPGKQYSLDKVAKETKPTPKSVNDSYHTVVSGETYYSISKKLDVSLNALMAANPTVKPERLSPGTKLKLPAGAAAIAKAPAPTNTPAKAKTHTVRTGESVLSISEKYHVTPEALLKHNNLKSADDLYIGDTLKIPENKTSASSDKIATSGKTNTPKVTQETKVKEEAAPESNVVTYTVSATETAETISEAYNISKKRLLEYNRMTPNAKLKPGDVIKIPTGDTKVVSR